MRWIRAGVIRITGGRSLKVTGSVDSGLGLPSGVVRELVARS
jgi:hypothetical protein